MALNNQGDLSLRQGDVQAAHDYYQEVGAITIEMGRQHEAIWLGNLANVHRQIGNYDDALAGYRNALRIHQELGDKRGETETLIGIGSTFQQIGKYAEALVHHERALAISCDISERYEEAKALRYIGMALLSSGRYTTALDHFRQALAVANQIDEVFEKAKALEGIGSTLLYLEGRAHAEKYWKRALNLYERLGAPEAGIIQSYLQKPSDGPRLAD
jgi:tetratricopeptide (TPR) repeat protein